MSRGIHTNTRTSAGIKAVAAAMAIAITATGALVIATPQNALANDGYDSSAPVVNKSSHYEGESVTIWPDSIQPVYAEWHQDDNGNWWATFWTYNYTKVYAKPAPAGCGWVFYAEESDGSFTQIIRNEMESTEDDGRLGPNGIASHWRSLEGDRWY